MECPSAKKPEPPPKTRTGAELLEAEGISVVSVHLFLETGGWRLFSPESICLMFGCPLHLVEGPGLDSGSVPSRAVVRNSVYMKEASGKDLTGWEANTQS